MLVSIFPGILTFVLTVVGIPAFIRFYRKAQITGQQMQKSAVSIWAIKPTTGTS